MTVAVLAAGALLAGCGADNRPTATITDGNGKTVVVTQAEPRAKPEPGHDVNGGYLPGPVGQQAYCAENNWAYEPATNTCRVR